MLSISRHSLFKSNQLRTLRRKIANFILTKKTTTSKNNKIKCGTQKIKIIYDPRCRVHATESFNLILVFDLLGGDLEYFCVCMLTIFFFIEIIWNAVVFYILTLNRCQNWKGSSLNDLNRTEDQNKLLGYVSDHLYKEIFIIKTATKNITSLFENFQGEFWNRWVKNNIYCLYWNRAISFWEY